MAQVQLRQFGALRKSANVTNAIRANIEHEKVRQLPHLFSENGEAVVAEIQHRERLSQPPKYERMAAAPNHIVGEVQTPAAGFNLHHALYQRVVDLLDHGNG